MTPERIPPPPKIVTYIRKVTKADKEAKVSDTKPPNLPEKEPYEYSAPKTLISPNSNDKDNEASSDDIFHQQNEALSSDVVQQNIEIRKCNRQKYIFNSKWSNSRMISCTSTT